MQKKLIALAVAGLMAAPVMAQSNVTIYGIVDIGIQHGSSSTVSGAKSRTGLDSGLDNGSRIGFRGTEDLGNGLKAGFVLEQGFNVDTGAPDSSLQFHRQAFVSLSGGFGTVALGRQYTPQHSMLSRLDPFGIRNGAGSAAGGDRWMHDSRLDNTIAYVSPNMNGFNVVVAHSLNAGGQEVQKDAGNAKVWAVSPRYTNGPLDVQLNYHRIKSDASGATATKVWDLGGAYDFGAVKLAAVYGTRKASNIVDKRSWLLGATVPVSDAGAVKLSYVHSKEREADNTSKQWALGYQHNLSSRTYLYTNFARRSGDLTAADYRMDVPYRNRFDLGVRHAF